MNWTNPFSWRKKREEQLIAKEGFLNNTLLKNTNVQEALTQVQKESMEIARKNQQLTEEIKKLVIENERTKNILLERENSIKKQLHDLDERLQSIRKEEIIIETRKSDLRSKEHKTESEQKEIDKERKAIREREEVSDKIKRQAEEDKLKYEKLHSEIENEKSKATELEQELKRKNNEADRKIAESNAIFEKAKIIDEEMKRKEKLFEDERVKIEAALREKIEEVDRRLADLDNVKEVVDDIKYDDSEFGRSAKIVVKESIRKAMNMLKDMIVEFEQLNEKYASGTFKGFSTPITEIDKCFNDLKTQYQQVKEHIDSNEELPSTVIKWLDCIEEYILKADTAKKSWELSEAYRYITLGLATCKNYELLLHILCGWTQGEHEGNTHSEMPNEGFTDWYEVLEVTPEATLEEIKKQRNALLNKYHPDRSTEETREEYTKKTVQIIEAYETLSDEAKRKEFDNKRNNYKKNNYEK